MTKTKYMFSEAKAKAKDTTSEANAKAKDLAFKAKAKAKDLAPKAKAKDMTSCPRGASRPRPWPRGLHLCNKNAQNPATHLVFLINLHSGDPWPTWPIASVIFVAKIKTRTRITVIKKTKTK